MNRYQYWLMPHNPALKRDAVNGVVFSSTFGMPRPLALSWAAEMKILGKVVCH